MKTKLQAQILFLLAACLFVLNVVHTSLKNAQTGQSPSRAAPLPPLQLLQSPDADQREKGSAALMQSQEDTEDKVQAIAERFLKQSAQRRDKNPGDPMNQMGNQDDRAALYSIAMLGEFRSTRSIPFLIDHLPVFIFADNAHTTGEAYPCVGALVSIGSPSLDPLLMRVEQTDNPLTMQLAAYVYVEVLETNKGAVDFIRDRRYRLKSPIAKRRLDHLEDAVARTRKFP